MEDPSAIPLCNTADLVEGGLAVPFDVIYGGQTCRAFAIRWEGQVHAALINMRFIASSFVLAYLACPWRATMPN